MVIPANGKTQRQENSSCIWVILVAAGLRDRVGKHQTHGNLCFLPSSVFCRAGCLCVAERTPDEMQGQHGEQEKIWGKILTKM